jgi:small subunit ribosomal protein S16
MFEAVFKLWHLDELIPLHPQKNTRASSYVQDLYITRSIRCSRFVGPRGGHTSRSQSELRIRLSAKTHPQPDQLPTSTYAIHAFSTERLVNLFPDLFEPLHILPRNMVVRIRLARFGRKRQPIYNIVVSQARTARGSKPMEVLGTYDPLPRVPLANNNTPDTMLDAEGNRVPFVPKQYKDIQLDTSRTKYWLGVGAQPSEPVEKLLCMVSKRIGEPGSKWESGR